MEVGTKEGSNGIYRHGRHRVRSTSYRKGKRFIQTIFPLLAISAIAAFIFDASLRYWLHYVYSGLRARIEYARKYAGHPSPASRSYVYMIGQSHIDPSWLWTTRETRTSIIPQTFGDAITGLERFPDLSYSQGTAQLYQWTEADHPHLFSEIRHFVERGQWEVVGGSWVEFDANLPSGESLARQFLYGQRYFRSKFHRLANVAWLPDSFGYAWTLPQILKKSGLDYFFTNQLNDGIDPLRTRFPQQQFWWQAPDGSRVLSTCGTGYYSTLQPDEIYWDALAAGETRMVAELFGYGDHGGGPQVGMIARGRALQNKADFPKVRFSRAGDYFRELETRASALNLPVIDDELYLKRFQGTFTTEAVVKSANRKAETSLIMAEQLASIAAFYGMLYPREQLGRAWKLLLFCQSHDNINGTSLLPVYRELDRFHGEAQSIADSVIHAAMDFLARQIRMPSTRGVPLLVYNPLSWKQTAPVRISLPEKLPMAVRNHLGQPVLSQMVSRGGGAMMIFTAREVPAHGGRVYFLLPGGRSEPIRKVSSVRKMAAGRFAVAFDGNGRLSGILDRSLGRQLLGAGGLTLRVYEDRPPDAPGGMPAWNIHLGRWRDLEGTVPKLMEDGPIRKTVRTSYALGDSKIEQDVHLYKQVPYIEFELRVDWREKYRFLKMRLALPFASPFATFDIPFGTIDRFDYTQERNTGPVLEHPRRAWQPSDREKQEVPAQFWADVSAPDGSFGLAVLNESKYGYSFSGSALELSLIRGVRRGFPNTKESWTDQSSDARVGVHHIRFALYPHSSGSFAGAVMRRAYEYNYPLLAQIVTRANGNLHPGHSFLEMDSPSVICTARKIAEDSEDTVLRLVEMSGHNQVVQLRFDRDVEAASSLDLLESRHHVVPERFAVTGSVVAVPIGRHEIKTVLVRFHKGL